MRTYYCVDSVFLVPHRIRHYFAVLQWWMGQQRAQSPYDQIRLSPPVDATAKAELTVDAEQ
jgi:hypothetical protein